MAACGGGGNSGTSTPPLTTTYTLSGSVSNLTSMGLVLSNGADSINVQANATSISFPSHLSSGTTYGVSIISQPLGFTDACTVANASGIVGKANVTNIIVACHPAVAMVSTLAGSGNEGSANGVGIAASFFSPYGLAVDNVGNVYVGDSDNHAIRKITAIGVVTTLAGSGNWGSANGIGIAASFAVPRGIALDALGNAYVADSNNNLIRKITSTGLVTTFAGSGHRGNVNGVGAEASFNYPTGVAVDASGNVYVVDSSNFLIRKITTSGVVTTFAGSGNYGSANGIGIAASFGAPDGIAVDSLGNIYVADTGNNLIRKITSTGVVTTLAGSGAIGRENGTGIAVSFLFPNAVAVDVLGNVYVADGDSLIRKITSTGEVTTLAGHDGIGNANGIGVAASFLNTRGIAVDALGNVFVADYANKLVRKISPQ